MSYDWKVGDRVVLQHGHSGHERITTIHRVTPSGLAQLAPTGHPAHDAQLWRQDGFQRGASGYHRSTIRPERPGDRERLQAAYARRRLHRKLLQAHNERLCDKLDLQDVESCLAELEGWLHRGAERVVG